MKLSFEQLVVEVEKLYANTIHESQLDEECRIIAALIEAAGWDETEYWAQWLSHQDLTN